MSLHADAVAVLTAWTAPDDGQECLRSAYLAHLATHPDGVWKAGPPVHLTASAVVVDERADRVLLTFHRKGRFWVQPGGHLEPGDTTLADAALREATEETGVAGLRLLPDPVDLDRHALSTAFGRCAEHLDVRYVAVAPSGAVPVVSDESEDVRWWPWDALPEPAGDLGRLVAAARRALAPAGG